MPFIDIGAPKGYSKARVLKIVNDYYKVANEINKNRRNGNINKQTLIYVLSESYSDPSRIPNVFVTGNPVQNITNIKKKTTSGLMLSSGYGGGTANMEYMADTSLSMNFFSGTLSTPFTQLVPKQKNVTAITNLFKIKNAIHTNTSTFYSRKEVYKKFGFQTFRSTDSKGKQKLKYNKKIEKSEYVGDNQAYENVLWQVNKRKSGQFISLVTMQNHVPFSNKYNKDEYSVSGSAVSGNEKSAENYVEGIHLTDKFTKKFLQQLDKIKKPITILWYGDHLAALYNGDSMREYNIALHETDYFIYSNKYARQNGYGQQKIRSKTKVVSPNTFSALVMEAMNQKVTPYYALITNVQKELPALGLDVNGSKNGLLVNNDNKRTYVSHFSKKQKEIYEDYKMIQYDIVAGKQYSLKTNFMK